MPQFLFMTQKMKVEFEDGAAADTVMQEVLKNCKKVESDCEIFYKLNLIDMKGCGLYD